MSRKKIMFLGASVFQVPPIECALEKGYTVITVDNRPENPGHKIAHRSYDISTVNKESVLELAKYEKIDGIMTFGSDVSAPTVSFVRNTMKLPGYENSYKAIETLVKKDKFRKFMFEEGIQKIFFETFELKEIDDIKRRLKNVSFPLIVKPVDSSGSKGVNKLVSTEGLLPYIEDAFKASMCKRIIVESFIEKKGHQICGDGFMSAGKIVFIEYGHGHFYDGAKFLAPYAESFPCTCSDKLLDDLSSRLETILKAVGFSLGPFNFDVLINKSNEIFVSEIGPRCGGNYIPSIIYLNTGVNLIEASVESAMHRDFSFTFEKNSFKNGCFAGYMVHTLESGILSDILFDESIKSNIYNYVPYKTKGEEVYSFKQANYAIGHLMLKFDSKKEMEMKMKIINSLVVVKLE